MLLLAFQWATSQSRHFEDTLLAFGFSNRSCPVQQRRQPSLPRSRNLSQATESGRGLDVRFTVNISEKPNGNESHIRTLVEPMLQPNNYPCESSKQGQPKGHGPSHFFAILKVDGPMDGGSYKLWTLGLFEVLR